MPDSIEQRAQALFEKRLRAQKLEPARGALAAVSTEILQLTERARNTLLALRPTSDAPPPSVPSPAPAIEEALALTERHLAASQHPVTGNADPALLTARTEYLATAWSAVALRLRPLTQTLQEQQQAVEALAKREKRLAEKLWREEAAFTRLQEKPGVYDATTPRSGGPTKRQERRLEQERLCAQIRADLQKLETRVRQNEPLKGLQIPQEETGEPASLTTILSHIRERVAAIDALTIQIGDPREHFRELYQSCLRDAECRGSVGEVTPAHQQEIRAALEAAADSYLPLYRQARDGAREEILRSLPKGAPRMPQNLLNNLITKRLEELKHTKAFVVSSISKMNAITAILPEDFDESMDCLERLEHEFSARHSALELQAQDGCRKRKSIEGRIMRASESGQPGLPLRPIRQHSNRFLETEELYEQAAMAMWKAHILTSLRRISQWWHPFKTLRRWVRKRRAASTPSSSPARPPRA
ncbi:MAG: hypothetical protein Greene041619_156 [Candidatus Peregrinibacteria bacterium Greene0416_19]|nr:MAG: hypothetical protein Greene041619_156 [Candidatus Peregrinibacteria bacterium Greene0416_19]